MLRKLLMAGYRVQFSKTTPAQFLKMEAGAKYASVKDDRHALEVAEDALEMMKKGVMFPGFENDMRIFVCEDVFAEGDKLQPPTMVIHDAVQPDGPRCTNRLVFLACAFRPASQCRNSRSPGLGGKGF